MRKVFVRKSPQKKYVWIKTVFLKKVPLQKQQRTMRAQRKCVENVDSFKKVPLTQQNVKMLYFGQLP